LLNGKSALSSEMAVRLEKAFGADRKQLLDMQAAYDRQEQRAGDKEIAVRALVPHFMSIKARQIEDWAGTTEARSYLPVLLRKLVNSTGNDLRRVDFPGYDNAQRKGSDGFIEADAATPWVPKGNSYWEFGTSKKPGEKAEKDYTARSTLVDPDRRANSTFVFVTPRNWPNKTSWEKKKNEAGHWKTVRAFDASDLEQWLEQSVLVQIWLAEQLGLPVSGYETLEQTWHRWASARVPHLTPEIFEPSITAYQGTFKAWLDKPSDRPLVVTADSRDEVLAMLACLFDNEEFRQYKDLAAVFTSSTTLKTLVASSVPFIPIVHSEDAERVLAAAHRQLHCIVFHPRNAVNTEADVALDRLSHDAFTKALIAMGIKESEADQLARESGRSPTILRRCLSQYPAIKTPEWASNKNTVKTLVPMVLIGAWQAESEADRKILSDMANQEYEAIEKDVAQLLQFDDSPVWSAGYYRGVTSKIDALFAIASMVTSEDLFVECLRHQRIESEARLVAYFLTTYLLHKRYPKMKTALRTTAASILALTLASPAFGKMPYPGFERDMRMAFENDGKPMELALLSEQEMRETQGTAFPIWLTLLRNAYWGSWGGCGTYIALHDHGTYQWSGMSGSMLRGAALGAISTSPAFAAVAIPLSTYIQKHGGLLETLQHVTSQ